MLTSSEIEDFFFFSFFAERFRRGDNRIVMFSNAVSQIVDSDVERKLRAGRLLDLASASDAPN